MSAMNYWSVPEALEHLSELDDKCSLEHIVSCYVSFLCLGRKTQFHKKRNERLRDGGRIQMFRLNIRINH